MYQIDLTQCEFMRCPTFSIAFSIPEKKKSYFIFRSELFELLYLDLDSERREGRGALSINFQRRVLKPILAYSTCTQYSGAKFAYIYLDLVFFWNPSFKCSNGDPAEYRKAK